MKTCNWTVILMEKQFINRSFSELSNKIARHIISKNDFQLEFPFFLPICICSIYEIMGNSICKSFFEGYKHSNKSILLSLSFSLPMRRMYECSFLSMSIWARDTRHLHKRSHLLHGTFYLEISHSKKRESPKYKRVEFIQEHNSFHSPRHWNETICCVAYRRLSSDIMAI